MSKMSMLVPPQVKPGKRISSLLSIGSSKEATSPRSSASNSPNIDSQHSPGHGSLDGGRNSERVLRHSASAHNLSSRAPLVDNDAPLPPPPSLVTVNQDLADSSNNPSYNRPRSAGGNRPGSSGGLRPGSSGGLKVRPGSMGGSRPGSPASDSRQSKRMSWLPGSRSRRSSSEEEKPRMPTKNSAWVAGLPERYPYDLTPLINGERVCHVPLPSPIE